MSGLSPAAPIFPVANLATAIDYYVNILGFRLTWLEAELRARGGKIRHPATNYSWALEMQVEDPDGNVLRFGSDPIKGRPFGEFPDMHGRLWPTV